ncbi:hypothetical protein GH984_07420 [Spiribacter sp. C176]|uniref:Uncharacterized protein n=1 Tax=Spiribacter salilacus TaxID=2664894 RepID=A0A6N7QT13_9GAMM|nr:hypothetical protein [Spiribacter salilacus]
MVPPVFFHENTWVTLLARPGESKAKSDLGNLREDEQEQFKKAAKAILALSDDQIRQLIENGQFEEVKKDG